MCDRPPRRWRRRAIVVLAFLVGVTACAAAAIRLYLTPARSASLIAAELAKLLDDHVEIGSASLGLVGPSTLTSLQAGDYLQAGSVTADLSAASAASGGRPTTLAMEDVTLRLRFGRDGRLLTKLPPNTGAGSIPAVEVSGGTLILEQEGRRPFSVRGTAVRLGRGGTIEGVIEDSRAGKFAATGRFETSPPRLQLTLTQEHARVTPALLREIPFIPPSLWDTLTADGDDVAVTVQLDIAATVSYRVQFRRAAVTLLQPDRPAFRVTGVGGQIAGDSAGFTVEGTVADPRWGDWAVDCKQANGTGAIDVHLKTAAPVKVDQKMLEALPFVPRTVWDNLKAEGRTPADVRVRLWADRPDVSYRVAVEPIDTRVHVTAIDLKAEGVSGKVVIEDNVVKLEKVSGATARGKVHTSGTLDFRGQTTSLAFAIRADQLWLKQLPARWELPEKFGGKISGEANIVVRIGETVTTTGTGRGRITEASFGLVPIFTPIELELYADKGRLKFRTGKTAMMQGLLGTILITVAPPVERPPPYSPAAVTAQVGDMALWLTRAIAGGARRAVDGLSELERLSRPGVETTYIEARFALKDVDLVTLADQFGMTLPAGLTGTASLDVTASIPINNARDARAYRLAGTLTSPRLGVGGHAMEDFRATLHYADGLARVDGLSARGFGGTARGGATARIAPLGNATFDLVVEGLSPAPLLPRDLHRKITGNLSGRIRLDVPLVRAADVRSWGGGAAVRAAKLDVFGVPLRDAEAELTLASGTLLVSHLRADLLGAVFQARGGINLIGGYRYDLSARLRGLDIATFPLLLPGQWSRLGLSGVADVSGRFQGTLAGGIEGSGRARMGTLRLGRVRADRVEGRWKLAGGKLSFDEVRGQTYGGELTGAGDVTPAGASLTLRIHGVDATEITRRVPGLEVPITGKIEATTSLTVGFDPLRADVRLDFAGSRIAVAGMPVRNLTARAVSSDGRIDYEGQGDLLGGRVRVEGRYPPPPVSPVGQPHGRVRIDRLYLGRALRGLGIDTGSNQWRGAVAVDLPFRFDGDGGSLTGQGRFEVRDLRYNDVEVADSIRGDVRLARQGIFLRDVSGTVAGGLLRVRGAHRLDDPSRGWFSLTLDGADAQRLAALFGPTGNAFRGRIDLSARGNLGPEWRGTGEVRLTRGRAGGVDVGEWGIPVEFTFAPARGAGEVKFRESSAQVGSGRARARGQVTFGESLRVDMTLLFSDAALGSLAGLIGDVSSYVRGQVSGRVDIGGSEVRSAEDLTASVHLTLRESQALELPILRQVAPFLLLPGGRATRFRSGEVRGRLSRGVFRFEEFTLDSAIAQLIIQGNVTTAGRLDLDVVARTTSLGTVNPVVVRLLLNRVPAVGPVPVGVIIQLTELLADRIIHLHVGGTLKTPVVQVEPLRLLSQEAARFLLTRLLR